jgi:glucose-6-phosphate isomerase
LDGSDCSLDQFDIKTERWLSDVVGMYLDQGALERVLSHGDRLLYRVYTAVPTDGPGGLCFDSVVIYPGLVGSEFHMTKGHYHEGPGSEVYFGLQGEGYILLQTQMGDFRALEFRRGIAAYIPSGWAHRTVNTSDVPLWFFGTYPSGLNHDYASVEKTGFAKLVVNDGGRPRIIDNPRFRMPSRREHPGGGE